MQKKEIIVYSVSGALLLASIVVLILCFKRMKQSVKGDIMGGSYFTIDELCASSTASRYGIDNTPTPEVRTRLQALIDNVLDPVRRTYGSYIQVNSGYRCPELNKKVGGASTSQHVKGEAADITGGSVENNRAIFRAIVALGIYDQLIWEKGGAWVHVSYRADGSNRLAMLNYDGRSYTSINNNWQSIV